MDRRPGPSPRVSTILLPSDVPLVAQANSPDGVMVACGSQALLGDGRRRGRTVRYPRPAGPGSQLTGHNIYI